MTSESPDNKKKIPANFNSLYKITSMPTRPNFSQPHKKKGTIEKIYTQMRGHESSALGS